MSVNKISKFIKIKNTRIALTEIAGYEVYDGNNEINILLNHGNIFIPCESEEEAIRIIHQLDRELSKLGVKFIEIE